MDWLDLLAVQGTLKSLLQHLSLKASILWRSAFFTVQLSHPYMTTGKTIALTRWTLVGIVMSLLFNMLSRLVITFLPRSKCLLISWLQSPSAVILEPPPKMKSDSFHCFPIYLPWSDGTRWHDLSFLNVEIQANFFTLLFHFHFCHTTMQISRNYTHLPFLPVGDFSVAQTVKNQPARQGARVWSPGWEVSLKKGMTIHSSILAWRIPWTEEPGGLQSMWS